ncbi:MAG: replication restart helicase PriA [Anaerolineae bacterium]|jgi:primosomal protein N' (replication factor Y)|nr:primosomal protein N' [Chloroflexota bacterium]
MTTDESLAPTRPRYALVAVDAGAARPRHVRDLSPVGDDSGEAPLEAFHYEIPASLSGLLPGSLVWVPFGPRHVRGVVMALVDSTPVARTRPIERLADPEPVLSPQQLELARWMAERYLAPLQHAIWAMIPPGSTEQVEQVVSLPDGQPDRQETSELTPQQSALLAWLREHAPVRLAALKRTASGRGWRTDLAALEEEGLVRIQPELSAPRVRPRFQDFVRLLTPLPEEAWGAVRTIRRRRALEALTYWRTQRADTQGWMPWGALAAESEATRADLRWLQSHGLVETVSRQVWRDPLAGKVFASVVPPQLTVDQAEAWSVLLQGLEEQPARTFLLQGVTGSGKTELYLRAVQRVLEQGKSAIVLVPEIALVPQTIQRFGARFPDTLAVMHSGLTPGERYDQWRRIRTGELRLVLGARSAILSPVQNLGLVVIDEEHEWTYKQDRSPDYHARDVALYLQKQLGATVILGSATPSLETRYRAERGEFVHLVLPRRVVGHRQSMGEKCPAPSQGSSPPLTEAKQVATPDAGAFGELPPVHVVDLRQELREGNARIFSRALDAALEQTLAAQQQAILFVNRRGAATFVLCRDCGHVLACPACALPFTYHREGEDLLCHRCNIRRPAPDHCPQCGSARIRYFGLGTQRVEDELRARYPGARVVRWDQDTARVRGSQDAFLDSFLRGEADVLVGTQMVAKGLDLPRVTLVGVVSADTLLNLPDLRASERTFQLLAQVAGRAGRSPLGGQVIIQTYAPEHPAVVAASAHDYERFYRQEIAFRRTHWYPPLSRLIRLLYTGSNASRAQSAAEELYRTLSLRIQRQGLPEVDLIGPAPAYYSRLRDKWRWQILVRGRQPAEALHDMVLPQGWRIEVDPESLL